MTEKSGLPRVPVAAAILRRHGSILAAQRAEGKPFGGYWELPGGKLEGDETPGEALCRELAEELGINVLEYAPYKVVEYDYPERNFRVILHFYEVTRFRGEPIPKEGQNLRWVTPEDIRELTFLPADAEMFQCLLGENAGACAEHGTAD